MSNDIQKADQIAHRFYTKLCLVVSNARATSELKSQSKVDKWFNLETPDSDLFKDHLRTYKAVSTAPAPPQFELQVLLSVPDLVTNQVLVHLAHDSSRSRVDPTPKHIVLENWLLNFTPSFSEAPGDSDADSVAPSTIYKHGIPLFRSIYSLLRILPSWKLYKKLRRRTSNAYRNGNLSIHLRVKGLDDGVSATDILDFDTPPAPNATPLQHQTHLFPAIPHPTGTLSLSINYLSSPNFQLDELESLLSSRFLSLDEGPEFTPTLAKNQQRDSLTGLPGSLSMRPSLPKSPPSSSIADRFVLPAANSHSRTNSMPASQSPRLGGFPMSRTSTGAGITAGSTSALSIASSRQDSSTAWSKEETGHFSGVSAAARVRLESMGGRSSSADLPSAPGPLAIRRPGINPVHPFKTSTLSSGSPSLHSPSPSLRQPSPLAAGNPSLPARPVPTSPNSSRVPHSSIGFGRQSPSSIGGRSEGDDTSPKIPARKRYSSSFGHRYAAAGGGGSVGSTGSGERAESTSFLGVPTDDDEISIFVKDIDARKPLNIQRQPLPASAQGPPTTPSHTKSDSTGSAGPMLTQQSEVDERLRHMNEMFLASLEGLGGSGGRRRGSMGGDSAGGSPISSSSGHGEGETRGMRRAEGVGTRRDTSMPRLGSLRSMSANDIASSGGSAEVMGKLELDEEPRARRVGPR
ncbi:autophagy-related protein 13-domain-containing protein [Suillus clintonianus]|uniref:autophagy-related protein 13-domain-containing protein n=1 Tax=Suillus clintonianus TaxID=1904413 RepID=UPI001B86D849|nr:autophagy-related protein 13-domain-containing protein [Suillus clintonianus]KAG2119376.1 autophagy-related protein 13-domain-containing protein [Suillus clintonianus]